VTAKAGRASARAPLSDRFQEAIDAAAMSAGLFGSDEYLAEWRRESRSCGEELQAEVDAEAARIEGLYGGARLEQLARAGGRETG
jgi:hypothetical protein